MLMTAEEALAQQGDLAVFGLKGNVQKVKYTQEYPTVPDAPLSYTEVTFNRNGKISTVDGVQVDKAKDIKITRDASGRITKVVRVFHEETDYEKSTATETHVFTYDTNGNKKYDDLEIKNDPGVTEQTRYMYVYNKQGFLFTEVHNSGGNVLGDRFTGYKTDSNGNWISCTRNTSLTNDEYNTQEAISRNITYWANTVVQKNDSIPVPPIPERRPERKTDEIDETGKTVKGVKEVKDVKEVKETKEIKEIRMRDDGTFYVPQNNPQTNGNNNNSQTKQIDNTQAKQGLKNNNIQTAKKSSVNDLQRFRLKGSVKRVQCYESIGFFIPTPLYMISDYHHITGGANFDEEGNLTKETEIVEGFEVTRNASRQIMKISYKSTVYDYDAEKDVPILYEKLYTYDAKGKLAKIEDQSVQNGKLSNKKVFTFVYNVKGLIAKCNIVFTEYIGKMAFSKNNTQTYTYTKFDSQGNWTERKGNNSDGDTWTDQQLIYYYE